MGSSKDAVKIPREPTSDSSHSIIPRLLSSPDILKDASKFKRLLRNNKHSGQHYYVPWYLQQTTKELAESYKLINQVEAERLHESSVLGTRSQWSLHESANSHKDGTSRYANVFPWDKNRVTLPVIADGCSDYINASHIRLSLPESSAYKRYYIATQGPTEQTVPDFWQMCYHQSDPHDVSKPIVIVMVTALAEKGVKKCYKYWPDGVDYEEILLHSNDQQFHFSLHLSLLKSKTNANYTYSKLLLTPVGENNQPVPGFKPKEVHHFYYDKWNDFSKPNGHQVLLELSRTAWKLNGDKNLHTGEYNTNPLYVHCSAGVGRSGTFITLDYLLNCCNLFINPPETVEDHNNDSHIEDPIQQIVLSLRDQRMMLVQSRSQYLFIYDTAEAVYQSVIHQAPGFK